MVYVIWSVSILSLLWFATKRSSVVLSYNGTMLFWPFTNISTNHNTAVSAAIRSGRNKVYLYWLKDCFGLPLLPSYVVFIVYKVRILLYHRMTETKYEQNRTFIKVRKSRKQIMVFSIHPKTKAILTCGPVSLFSCFFVNFLEKFRTLDFLTFSK